VTPWRRWLRFQGVGAIGAGVQLAVVWVLVRGAGVDYRIATLTGVLAALAHNFLWHRAWTWRDRAGRARAGVPAFARFVVSNGSVSLAGNVAVMALLVGAGGLPVVPANAIAIGVCGLVNFWSADRLVFGWGGGARR
jgi:putative flippase GtrA